jgi:hypothetical protein
MVERSTKPLAANAASPRNQSGNANDERLLALEVRARRLAFAVFEGSGLLDWGARSYAAGPLGVESSIEKLRFLLHLYAPPVVIARGTRHAKDRSSEAAAHALRTIKTELKRRSIRLVLVDRHDVRQFFAQYGCRAKHEIAALIANQFPELKWRVPRPRRPWDPEAYAVAVFDAVATALTFNNVSLIPKAVSANGIEGGIDGSSAGVRTE